MAVRIDEAIARNILNVGVTAFHEKDLAIRS
jgi:hypothetical protein